MSDKPAADSLKYQWRLLAIVLRSEWATGLDKTLAFEIIDNYRKDFGNSRARLSYLQKAAGADSKAVIASTRRLTEHGPFSVIRVGAGTRPTEYQLHFELVHESASSGAETTESVLPVAAYKAGIQDRMIDCAPASPPPTVGPDGTTAAGSAQDGFEELWKTYFPKRGQGDKKKARAAYNKIAPNPELHSALIAAAKAWFDTWAAQGKADAPRKHLDTRITGDHYECERPTAFKAKERKAKVDPVKPATEVIRSNDDNVVPQPAAFRIARVGTRIVDIIETDVIATGRTKILTILFRERDRPEEWKHEIIFEHYAARLQERGQRELKALCVALGLREIDDSSELHAPVSVTVAHDGALTYAAPCNDNQLEAA